MLQPQQRGRCAMLAHLMPHGRGKHVTSPRSFYKPIAAGIFGVKTQQPAAFCDMLYIEVQICFSWKLTNCHSCDLREWLRVV